MSSQFRIIVCLLFCVIILTGTVCCTSKPPLRLCLSDYSYKISIDTNETITNVTLYIPVPVKNGLPMVGPVSLEKEQFERENFTVDLIQSPHGLNMSDAFPIADWQPWFLKVSADRIDPIFSEEPEYSVEIDNMTQSSSPKVFINTLFPIGNESVILPKLDFIPPYRQEIDASSPEWIEFLPARTQQTTLFFADYSSLPNTQIEIRSYLLGSNIWAEPQTPGTVNTGIDGGGNEYQDGFVWTGTGELHGWYQAEGLFGSTKCVYPNLSHARWKEIVAAAEPRS